MSSSMGRSLNPIEKELLIFLYEKYFTTTQFTPLTEFIEINTGTSPEKIHDIFHQLAEENLTVYRGMGPMTEISEAGIVLLETKGFAPSELHTRQKGVRKLILEALEKDKKDGVPQDMYYEKILHSANVTELEFSANYPVLRYLGLMKKQGGFSITREGLEELQRLRSEEQWEMEYATMQNDNLKLSEETMNMAVLQVFSGGKQNKFNVVGRPYQKGNLEIKLGTIFTPEQRARAARCIEYLKDTGLLISTYSDLADPENWLEITDAGRDALAKGRIKKIFPPHQLTGLPQRDQYEEDLREILQEATKNNTPIACVMMDIDDLKGLNTSIGHQAADEVIKSFAKFLLSEVDGRGVLYHRSGDEFYTILKNTSGEESLLFVKRILGKLQQRKFKSSKGEHQISFSAGISCFPEHSSDSKILIDYFERAHQESKSTGKARATLYSDKGESDDIFKEIGSLPDENVHILLGVEQCYGWSEATIAWKVVNNLDNPIDLLEAKMYFSLKGARKKRVVRNVSGSAERIAPKNASRVWRYIVKDLQNELSPNLKKFPKMRKSVSIKLVVRYRDLEKTEIIEQETETLM